MHIYIIFTKFKLCAGAFKRVRNRHVTWIGTNMADQRKRLHRLLDLLVFFGFWIFFRASSKRKLMKNQRTLFWRKNGN